LHEENNTLHEYLTINSFNEVSCTVNYPVVVTAYASDLLSPIGIAA